jgi:hypothetical protein
MQLPFSLVLHFHQVSQDMASSLINLKALAEAKKSAAC